MKGVGVANFKRWGPAQNDLVAGAKREERSLVVCVGEMLLRGEQKKKRQLEVDSKLGTHVHNPSLH